MAVLDKLRPDGHDTRNARSVGLSTPRCPTCNQPVSRAKFTDIEGRQRAHDAEIERAAAARFAAKEPAIRKEAAAMATAEIASKLAVAEQEKNAAIKKIGAAAAETKLLLEAQRAALEKAADKRIAAEKEKRFADNLKHQQELEALRRRVAKDRPNELGEEGELDALGLLTKAFPDDQITRVPRGKNGGDIVHQIVQAGAVVGKLLFEAKNQKVYQHKWTSKAKQDQLTEQADHAVVVTAAFPAGQRELMVRDGVLVVSPPRLVATATWLRMHTIRTHSLKLSNQQQSDKAGRLYLFMSSDCVADRWDRMMRTMTRMRDALRAERIAHEKAWSDRGSQIDVLTTIRENFIEDLDRIFEGTESEVSP